MAKGHSGLSYKSSQGHLHNLNPYNNQHCMTDYLLTETIYGEGQSKFYLFKEAFYSVC